MKLKDLPRKNQIEILTHLNASGGGEAYGSELYTSANAASDPNGNEADAITGWSEAGLNGTGANVFESQGVVKAVGSYALKTDANDTPTANARIWIDLQAAPFSFVNGEEGRLVFQVRHIGTAGNTTWGCYLSVGDISSTNTIVEMNESTVVFQEVTYDWTHDANHRYLVIKERNGTNNGGLYIDTISIKKKI